MMTRSKVHSVSSAFVRLSALAEEVHIVAMPSPHDAVTTIEELRGLPHDGLRHELLDGEHVVTPSPRAVHQWVLSLLTEWLVTALQRLPGLEFMASPAEIVLDVATLVQPDLFVFWKERGKPMTSWDQIGLPVLVVEVLSPINAQRDRTQKRRIYQRAGVAEYWIVDLDARVSERWRSGDERPEICDTTLGWRPPGGPDTHELDVGSLFHRALDE